MRSGSGCINTNWVQEAAKPARNRDEVQLRHREKRFNREKPSAGVRGSSAARGRYGATALRRYGATALRRYGATALRRYGATALRRWHPQPFGTGARLDKTWSEAP